MIFLSTIVFYFPPKKMGTSSKELRRFYSPKVIELLPIHDCIFDEVKPQEQIMVHTAAAPTP